MKIKNHIVLRISPIVVFFFCLLLANDSSAQSDSTIVVDEEIVAEDSVKIHSPKKATLLSTFLPGAGQVYNRKYWKLPIVYGGLGLSVYYLNRNLDEIKFYRKHIKAEIDDDPNTINTSGQSLGNLNNNLDFYKRLRDWSYIAIAGVYVLQIVDANVDAHLHSFDVSDDLSLKVAPTLLLSQNTSAPGLSFSLTFKGK